MIVDNNDNDEETTKEVCKVLEFIASDDDFMNAVVLDVLTSGTIRTVHFTRDKIDFNQHLEQYF
jgi:hypothetical protein